MTGVGCCLNCRYRSGYLHMRDAVTLECSSPVFATCFMMGLWPISRGRGEMADAADLNKHECANRETDGVELLKVGET
jgi:hypothetical protein